MSEQLYKVVFKVDGVDFPTRLANGGRVSRQLREWRATESGKHFVNCYMNSRAEDDAYEIVVVLNNRDAALMLKLALG